MTRRRAGRRKGLSPDTRPPADRGLRLDNPISSWSRPMPRYPISSW